VIAVELEGAVARVTDLILSCRVMGRQVEHVMLHLASAYAAEHGAELHVEYRRTDRNGPCLKLLEESALAKRTDTLFVWDQPVPFAKPSAIALERRS